MNTFENGFLTEKKKKDLLEKEMATHSSILTWESHGQRSLVTVYRLQSVGLRRVGHD